MIGLFIAFAEERKQVQRLKNIKNYGKNKSMGIISPFYD